MNPCGALCDFMRRPYTVRCRPFRDSDLETDLVWYPALDTAPALPFPSAFTSLIWADEPWDHDGPGEIYVDTIKNNWEKARPNALGTHQCGTREDYVLGCVYDPNPPFVEYLPGQIPLCCGNNFLGSGGGVGGGRAAVTTLHPPCASCTCATEISLDTDYSWHFTAGSGDFRQWWVLRGIATPGVYRVTMVAAPPIPLFQVQLSIGQSDNCVGLLPIGEIDNGGTTDVLTSTGIGTDLTFQFITADTWTGNYTFRVTRIA